MKTLKTGIAVFFAGTINLLAQTDSLSSNAKLLCKITVEPGIGVSPLPLADITLSNIVEAKITKRISVISYTSLRENNLFLRRFNYITTTNNHTVTQKLGVGSSFYTKRCIHTLSILGGIKYDTYHESLNNPKFERFDVIVKSWSPDVGIVYGLKLGKQKMFFSPRLYIPLFPYPVKTIDITSADSNLANISFEFGVGIRLR
jgi:hypothetical protein